MAAAINSRPKILISLNDVNNSPNTPRQLDQFIPPPQTKPFRNKARQERHSVTPQEISVDSVLLLLNESLYGLSVLLPIVPGLQELLKQITEITDSLEARQDDINSHLDEEIFKAHAPPPTPAVTFPDSESPQMKNPFEKPETGIVTLRLWIYEIQKNAWLFNEKTLRYEYTTTNMLNQGYRRKKLLQLGEELYNSWVKMMLNMGLLLGQTQTKIQTNTTKNLNNLVVATGMEEVIENLEPSEARRIYMQGEKYLLGYGCEKSFDTAYKRFEVALTNQLAERLNLPEASAMLGMLLEFGIGHRKDISAAVKHYNAAVKNGNADAMNNLARMYETGKGCEVSKKTAFELYKKASQLGHLDALTNYAFMLEHGLGCEKNLSLAVETLKIAAEKEYAKAENALGSCYYRGVGVKKDYFEACKYFHLAAGRGYSHAMNNYGICLETGNGVQMDITRAKSQYQSAAEKRHPGGMYNLAYMFLKEEQYFLAIDHFYLAKSLGRLIILKSIDATFELGKLYENGCADSKGIILRQDLEMAIRFYEEAASQKHEGAALRHASILICGPPSLQNFPKAVELLHRCASSSEIEVDIYSGGILATPRSPNGNSEAQNILGELCELGLHDGMEGEPDLEQAAQWYRLAVQQGNDRAMFNMGALYEAGLAVEKDVYKSIKFYNESAKMGNEDARVRLEHFKELGIIS